MTSRDKRVVSTDPGAAEDRRSKVGGKGYLALLIHAVQTLERQQIPPSKSRSWDLKSRREWVRRWPELTVAISVFVAILFIVPVSALENIPAAAPKLASSSPPAVPAPFYPYLSNPSTFPTPDQLPNVSGILSLPQISNITIGSSYVYALLFVDDLPVVGNVLEFDTGYFSPAAAQSMALSGCTNNCTQHLPIVWNPPTPIAGYGGSPIQADALDIFGSGPGAVVLAGASSNNSTIVYDSISAGAAGSWEALSGDAAFEGGNVQLAASPTECDIEATTQISTATLATNFERCFPPVLAGPNRPTTTAVQGRTLGSLPSTAGISPETSGPAVVTGVIPNEAEPGQNVTVYGTGFTSLSTVTIGNVATAYSVLSTTRISAVMPLTTGAGDVQVLDAGGWSLANCSGQVAAGSRLVPGTPEIYSISPNATTATKSVTITGNGFTSSTGVTFGSTSATVTHWTSTSLTVTVPSGTGTVNVTASSDVYPYGTEYSAPTCGAVFHYAPVYLYSISPTRGEYPLTVTLYGENFSTSAKVYFGSKQATSVTRISSAELQVSAPWVTEIYDTVPVTVQQSSYTTDSVNFHYTRDVVSVSTIVPNHAPAHGQVIVYGSGFNSTASVEFGTKTGTSQVYVSPTELLADAPTGITRVVNVTVDQNPSMSLDTCGALFTEGTAYPAGTPEIISFSASQGVGGANVTIYGLNLSASDTVTFGDVPSPAINASLSNSTALNVEVPLGSGNVSVTVSGTAGTSPSTCTDDFSIIGEGNLVDALGTQEVTVQLPASVAAAPAMLPLPSVVHGLSYPFGSLGTAREGGFVFATIGGQLETYSDGGLVNSTARIASSLGSQDLDQLGDTALSIPGGQPGQLSIASDGAGEFVLLTSDQEGRTVIEAIVLQGLGLYWSGGNPELSFNWSEPTFVPPLAGSAEDPQVVAAPYGDFYATWLEDGAGPEQLEEAVFSPAGILIQGPSVVYGSGGGSASGHSATSQTLMVDPDGRLLIAWGSALGNTSGAISYTGAYSTPISELTLLESAWSNMTNPEFKPIGSSGILSAEAAVQTDLGNVGSDLAASKLCWAQYNASNLVYPNVTWYDYAPVVLGPLASTCHLSFGSSHDTEVANTGGDDSPSFYLGVETGWLMQSLGVGLMTDPNWTAAVSSSGPTGPFVPDTGSKITDPHEDSVQIAPVTQTQSVLWLNAIGTFHSNVSNLALTHGTSVCGSNVTTDAPESYQAVATEYVHGFNGNRALSGTFTSTTGIPSPYFTHLANAENGTWWDNVTVTFETKRVIINNGCGTGTPNNGTTVVSTPPSGWPTVETFHLTGKFTTGLDPSPYPVQILSSVNSKGNLENSVLWQNTVNSTAWLYLDGGTNFTWYNGNYISNDSATAGLGNVPGPLKGFGFNLTAGDALIPNGTAAQINTNQVNAVQPSESNRFSCTFGTLPSFKVWDKYGGNATNITTSSATFAWNSTLLPADTSGWVSLTELNGETLNFTAQVINITHNDTSEYSVVPVGLQPWGIFSVTFVVAANSACKSGSQTLADLASYTTLTGNELQVLGKPAMFEQDAPNDSITGEGGGATIAWLVPLAFETQPGTSFVNGTLTIKNVSNPSATPLIVPISPPLTAFTNYSQFGTNVHSNSATTYAVNVTELTPNNQYNVTLTLNYTTSSNPHFSATNSLTFWYEKDTSGDGLTDWEKEYGWYVWYTNLEQDPIAEHVTANVNAYSTNGLVSDYVEKEYGLNPNLVDSAGSHMLDTWNLTFALGNSSLPTGSNFETWNESTKYNPFGTGSPLTSGLNNITPTASHGLSSGDGSPWASQVLWSYAALQDFVALPGVVSSDWLRAVTGVYHGAYTLTVWGKLSWGANPLATSTLEDGLADGSQADPVNPEVVQFTMTSWGTTISGASGDAAGPYLEVTNQSDGQGAKFYGGYGPVDSNQSSPSWSGTYTASVPVRLAGRYAYYNVSVNANESGTLKLVGSTNQSIDLLSTSFGSLNNTWAKASLVGWYKVVRVAEAANTLLWTPANNTTLSNLPWGLKRYTGEPDFDLLVLNVSAATSVSGLSWATTKGTYGLSLSQGLNNILVPRSAFLTSPLAQALLNNTNETFRVSSGAAENFNGTNWSSRSETSGSNKVPTASSPNPNFIWVISSLNQFDGPSNGTGSTDFGGLPQDPLESGYQSRQVQSVIWVNISGYGSLKTDSEELASLFAGLTLNSTGGVADNLISVTNQLPLLGLSQSVLTALANISLANSGAFSPPTFNQHWNPPPSNGWGAVGSAIFNSVSGVVNLVTTVASVVWNGLTAAAAYVATAAAWLYEHTGLDHLANQLVTGLKALANAMIWAFDQILGYVIGLIRAAFGTVMDAATAGFKAAISSEQSSFNTGSSGAAWAYLSQHGTGTIPSNVTSDFETFILPIILVASVITVVLAIVLGIALPFSIGVGFLVGLAVPLLVEALSESTKTGTPSNSESSQFSTAAESESTLSVSATTSAAEKASNAIEPDNTTVLDQPVAEPYPSANWDWFGFLGAGIGLTAAVVGLFSGGASSGQATVAAGYIAAILGFVAMVLSILVIVNFADLPTPYTSSDATAYQEVQSEDIALAWVSFAGISLSLAGVLFDENPNARDVSFFGLLFSGIGEFSALADLNEIHSETA
jgi:IPT/TIG domain